MQIYRKRPEKCRFLEIGEIQRFQGEGNLLHDGSLPDVVIYILYLYCWALCVSLTHVWLSQVISPRLMASMCWGLMTFYLQLGLFSFLYTMLLQSLSSISTWISNRHLNIKKNRSFSSIFLANLSTSASHKPYTIFHHISLALFKVISIYNSPAILLAWLLK